MLRAIEETVEYIKRKTENFKPEIGIILGTGLGGLVKDIQIKSQIDYSEIPNFPVSTVESHSGKGGADHGIVPRHHAGTASRQPGDDARGS